MSSRHSYHIPFILRWLCLIISFTAAHLLQAEWRVLPAFERRQSSPPKNFSDGTVIKPGDSWPGDEKFRWLVGELEIPSVIGTEPTKGKIAGLRFNCGDGGEIYVNDKLQSRFDNDHPALVILSTNAVPGNKVRIAVQVYGKVQGGDKFDQAEWVTIDSKRGLDTLVVKINPQIKMGKVPEGIVGLSQGGGMSDYEDATANKLREGGFKWFRMDNVFTSVLKKDSEGKFVYDWSEFDRRVDFITKIGAEPIFAVSYMPEVLDAVPNHERQSAPKDYAVWEELCFQAAKRSLDRGKRIAFWEVWNEVNTGWLKPGPEDTGGETFKKLYAQAIGREDASPDTVRRFEAYCKLYRATARGVLRADQKAKIGGPALASGPFENSECGHCFHGKGFARGLMLWCEQERLPLHFVSWHEYFQAPETIGREAEAFRSYLHDFPNLKKQVTSFMITEWNEAWWADRPQDHELGAAWCANSITRAFIPARIDRPCFFYVKQGDMNFRGDYSLLMQGNLPKASYNVAKIFNGLSGDWIEVSSGDEDISAVAAWDVKRSRLAIVLVNFRDRYAMGRRVQVRVEKLAAELKGGRWQEWLVDATHSNVWHDQNGAELTKAGGGALSGDKFVFEKELLANSVTLLELGNE